VEFGFDRSRRIDTETASALGKVDDGWVTMHGPKVAMRRAKGEDILQVAGAARARAGTAASSAADDGAGAGVP
jgi:anaerobic magnesium-protoporphyrin IX monomethyl ester cyclase